MVTLAFLVAACLDPVQAALVLVILVAYRGFQPIVVAGVLAALISETVMAIAASDYVWGELIAPRLVAALLQAAVLVLLVKIVQSAARGAAAALGTGRVLSAGSVPRLEAVDSRPVPYRMAPWHVRSFVRRRISELRSKKNAAVSCESE